MKQIEKKILIDLFKSTDGLQCYTLYSSYNISPLDLVNFIDKYEGSELITNNDFKLKLTLKGKSFMENMFPKSLSTTRGLFNSIPEECKGTKISLDEFYIPNMLLMPSIIDKKD